MNIPDIGSLVPHAGPMVLLDRVISADEESLCAEVSIRSDSLFCGAEGVAAWVGLEYMAQTISAYAGYSAHLRGDPVKIGFLLGTRCYECSRPFFAVGTRLRIHVKRLFQSENGMGSFECRIDDGQENLASVILTVYQPADGDQSSDPRSP
ncbi:MAG: 3-hydroxylacyl-ACP dehydratase [Candidatus Binatia bacterium]